MPKFISNGREWIPVTKFTRMELEAKGLTSIKTGGQPSAEAVTSEAPIDGEDQVLATGSEAQKTKLSSVTERRGVKGGKTTKVRV